MLLSLSTHGKLRALMVLMDTSTRKLGIQLGKLSLPSFRNSLKVHNWLKSSDQSAFAMRYIKQSRRSLFLPGRQIIDNVILVMEAIKSVNAE